MWSSVVNLLQFLRVVDNDLSGYYRTSVEQICVYLQVTCVRFSGVDDCLTTDYKNTISNVHGAPVICAVYNNYYKVYWYIYIIPM